MAQKWRGSVSVPPLRKQWMVGGEQPRDWQFPRVIAEQPDGERDGEGRRKLETPDGTRWTDGVRRDPLYPAEPDSRDPRMKK